MKFSVAYLAGNNISDQHLCLKRLKFLLFLLINGFYLIEPGKDKIEIFSIGNNLLSKRVLFVKF